MKSEPGYARGVVSGNDVDVAPRPIHVGRAHPERRAVDQDSAAPAFFDALNKFRQPVLKLRRGHVRSAVEPAQLDQIVRWTIEHLTPLVSVYQLNHGITS